MKWHYEKCCIEMLFVLSLIAGVSNVIASICSQIAYQQGGTVCACAVPVKNLDILSHSSELEVIQTFTVQNFLQVTVSFFHIIKMHFRFTNHCQVRVWVVSQS